MGKNEKIRLFSIFLILPSTELAMDLSDKTREKPSVFHSSLILIRRNPNKIHSSPFFPFFSRI